MSIKRIMLCLIVSVTFIPAMVYAQEASDEYRLIANDFVQGWLSKRISNTQETKFCGVAIGEVMNNTCLGDPFKVYTLSYKDIIGSDVPDLTKALIFVAYGYPLTIGDQEYGVIFVNIKEKVAGFSSGSDTDNYIIKMMREPGNTSKNIEFSKVHLDSRYHELVIMRKDEIRYLTTLKSGTAEKFNIEINDNNIPTLTMCEMMPRLQAYSREMCEKNEKEFIK